MKINVWKKVIRIGRIGVCFLACTAIVMGLRHLSFGKWIRQAALVSFGMQMTYWQEDFSVHLKQNSSTSAKDPISVGPFSPSSEGQAKPPEDIRGIQWVEFDIPEPQPAPDEKGDGGKIREMQMSGGQYQVDGVRYTNRSDRTDIDMEALLENAPNLKLYGEEPVVLLMHTHTTECYMSYDAGYYNKSDASRTQNEKENVVLIGEMLAQQLRAAGVPTLHDATVHDYPQYSNAYSRSLKTVEKILKQYPSIQVVIDVHRDGVMADETTKVKPTVVIDGEKTAQVMLLVGTSDTSSAPNAGWKDNLSMAARLQRFADASQDGLMRPMVLRNGRFNQHTAPYCFLVEMGSDSNTLSEAMRAADLFGRRLALYLNEELQRE